jgi:cell division protein FtsW
MKRFSLPRKKDVSSDYGMDTPMLVIILLLLTLGSIMVFSASQVYAQKRYGVEQYFMIRQCVFALVGIATMIGVSKINDSLLRKYTLAIYCATLLCLIAVLIVGTASGVAKRWIYIGPFSIQPTEIAKFTVVLVLAWYFEKYEEKVHEDRYFWQSSVYGVFLPLGILLSFLLLILLENHFSGMIILFLIGMAMILIGGARKFWFLLTGSIAAVGILVMILFVDYAKERIDTWLHPENYSLQGEVWQTIQGKYAIGNGGLFGVGLGNSLQKQLFVSAPQNDFIFSIACEELGLIGAALILLLFAFFAWRGIYLGLRAPDTFSALLAIGITCHVTIQAILNIMVVTALLPNTGITLPFFSYGGSALIVLMGEMGVLLGISRRISQK